MFKAAAGRKQGLDLRQKQVGIDGLGILAAEPEALLIGAILDLPPPGIGRLRRGLQPEQKGWVRVDREALDKRARQQAATVRVELKEQRAFGKLDATPVFWSKALTGDTQILAAGQHLTRRFALQHVRYHIAL